MCAGHGASNETRLRSPRHGSRPPFAARHGSRCVRRAVARSARPVPASRIGTAWARRTQPRRTSPQASALAIAWQEQPWQVPAFARRGSSRPGSPAACLARGRRSRRRSVPTSSNPRSLSVGAARKPGRSLVVVNANASAALATLAARPTTGQIESAMWSVVGHARSPAVTSPKFPLVR